MALWQISFFIIPKQSLDIHPVPFKDEEDLFDDSVYWNENYISSLFDSIVLFLPEGKSWSENIRLFGDEQSNRFQILTEANKIVSVSFRIDFTSGYEEVLRGIIEFCLMNNFAIITTDMEMLSLNFEIVNAHIEQSPQVIRYNQLSRQ